MKRLVTALAAGAALSTVAFASASVLTVDAAAIQAGGDGVTCDSDGVQADWGLETSDNTVRWVDVEGIDAACEGAELFVQVSGGATRTVDIAGTTARVSFPAPYPTPESITNIKIWIEG